MVDQSERSGGFVFSVKHKGPPAEKSEADGKVASCWAGRVWLAGSSPWMVIMDVWANRLAGMDASNGFSN